MITDGSDGTTTTLATNTYYSPTDTTPGAFPGQIQYSTDTAGQKTFYAYDTAGNQMSVIT